MRLGLLFEKYETIKNSLDGQNKQWTFEVPSDIYKNEIGLA